MTEPVEHAGIIPALLAVQEEIVNPKSTKDGHYNKYCPLPELLDMVRPLLTKHGIISIQKLGHVVGPEGKLIPCGKTDLVHITDPEQKNIVSSDWLPLNPESDRNPQKLGGASTYNRRYQLSAILGIASEHDDDAESHNESNKSNGNRTNRTPRQIVDNSSEPEKTESAETEGETATTEKPRTQRTPRKKVTTEEGLEMTEVKGKNHDKTPSPDVPKQSEKSDANVGNTQRAERTPRKKVEPKKDESASKPKVDRSKESIPMDVPETNELLIKVKEVCPILYNKCKDGVNKDQVITKEWLKTLAQDMLGHDMISQDQLGLVKEALDV